MNKNPPRISALTPRISAQRIRHSRFILLLICIALLPSQTAAQQFDLALDHYNVEDGLSQSTVWNIFEDSKGLMWFCTPDGLNKFDGYSFTVYRNRKGDSSSIASNHVMFIFEDSSANLWIGHSGGLSRYETRSDRFRVVYQLPVRSSDDESVIPLRESNGKIWAWDKRRGIIGFNRETLKEEIVHLIDPRFRDHMNANSRFGKTIGDKVFISTTDDVMVIFDFNTLEYKFLFHNELDSGYRGLIATNKFAVDQNNNIWISGQGGVVRLNTRTLERKEYKKNFDGLNFTSCSFGPDGRLWVGSMTNGLFLLDTLSGQTIGIDRKNNRRDGLLHSYIESLFLDSSDNMWIGTNGFGIHKYSMHKNKFDHLNLETAKSPFGANLVKAIGEGKNGNLYIGTFDNGLFRVRPNGDVTNFLVTGSNKATSLAVGTNDEVIVANDHEVFVLREQVIASLGLNMNNVSISSLYRLQDGEVLMTTSIGVFRLNKKSGRYGAEAMWPMVDMPMATVLYEDSGGRLWIGTQRSFFLVDGLGSTPRLMEQVTTNFVKSFCEDDSGNIWIATLGDLVRFHPGRGEIETLNEQAGFVNTFFYAALAGNDGKIWVSSNKGLASYDASTRVVENYSTHDGLLSDEFNTGAFCRLNDGRLAFGNLNGVNLFDPKSIKHNSNLPRIVLTNFLVDDQPFALDTSILYKRRIELPYSRNTFSFGFSGLEYTAPENNSYAYMLEGQDKDWVNGGHVRFARYSRLAPGGYEFKVKATNSDGVWNETPATIYVVIRPPFYLQDWFRILLSIVAVLVIAGISIAIVRRRYGSKLRRLEVDHKVQLERGRISRDLHDHVGSQLTFIINQLDGSPRDILDKDLLSEAREAARVTMGNLRETIWALNRETITAVDFSDRVKEFAMKQLKSNASMQLDFSEQLAGERTLNPSKALNLFRIAQEAINNAVKHSRGSVLSILIQNSEGYFKLRIADNGQAFQSGTGTAGYGLQNMAYRVKEIGGKLEVVSEPANGTAVTVSFQEE